MPGSPFPTVPVLLRTACWAGLAAVSGCRGPGTAANDAGASPDRPTVAPRAPATAATAPPATEFPDPESPMSDAPAPARSTYDELRPKLGPQLFHQTWTLIEQPERSAVEDELMLHCAHASRFFWQEYGGPLEWARGDWLLAHVSALLGRGAEALRYANLCHEAAEHDFESPFDHAVAHTAMARAYAAMGDRENCAKHVKLAEERGALIPDEDDRRRHFEQLAAGPWFGMRD